MEVQGVSPERVNEVEEASVAGGQVDASGNLVLITVGGVQKNAGSVVKPLFSWPVGSIYIGVNSTNPADLFGGGTWERFGNGRVLVSQDPNDVQFDGALEVGGAKTHQLTAAESGMPGHNHLQNAHNHDSSGHSHAVLNPGTGGEGTVGSASALFRFGTPGDGNSTYAPAGSVYGGTSAHVTDPNIAATATNQAAPAQNAASAHNNLQPYIVVYMWRRTA